MALFIEQFHFMRPLWLLALLPIAALLALLWRSHYQSQQWHKHIAPQLLPALLEGGLSRTNRAVFFAIALSWLLACLALAGPTWQKQPSPVVQNTEALVICWDLSPSMLAEDISPSRLARSRLKIIDLLKSRPDGQTALIAFSGEAYTVTPLTDDIQTIINLLPALAPNTLPTLGSNPEMAYKQASELLNQAGILQGKIVMITDEIPSDALSTLSDLVANSSHKLTLWGIGTANGAPIPWGKQGFAKDSSGAIALAKLNEDELRKFAVQTGSYYVPVVNDNSDIAALQSLLADAPSEAESKSTEQLFDQWLEQGHWLVWACLVLLLFGFRRGWLLCAAFVLPSTLLPTDAHASPFKTKDQTGFEAYQQENYEQAASAFEDKSWQGAANYRNENYSAAAQAFAQQNTASGKFNQGNAELLQGNFEQAIKTYDKALELDPNLEAAQKNKQLAQALKQQQEEQQQESNQESSDDQEQPDEQEQSQEQQSQDGDSENQNSNEQQSEESEQQSQQQNAEQGTSSSADAQSGMQGSSSEESQSSAAAQQGEATSSDGENSSEAAAAQQALEAEKTEEPQTEEQQMLEQVLRKVPDDPAGLLRAKFQHQFRQRQQELRRGGDFDDTKQAEQRW